MGGGGGTIMTLVPTRANRISVGDSRGEKAQGASGAIARGPVSSPR